MLAIKRSVLRTRLGLTTGGCGLGLISALAAQVVAAPACRADVTVTGSYVGANGQAGNTSTSTDDNGVVNLSAASGADGYDPATADRYTFAPSASATAGNGADIVGTDSTVIYQGGSGGTGVSSSNATALTFSGGTYTGGNGGNATGNGYALLGGSGGNGVYVGGGATALVNAGTFTGGSRGVADGTQAFGAGFSYVGGAGLAVQGSSVLTVTGGTVTGGTGQDVDSSGSGLIVFGGTANLYGGTFNAAAPALADDNGDFDKGLFLFGGTVTLYGTSFTVDGVPVSSGQVAEAVGTITGLLQDNGDQTAITFDNNDNGGTLDLVDVAAPEPTSLTLLAVGSGGLLARRRRRPSNQSDGRADAHC